MNGHDVSSVDHATTVNYLKEGDSVELEVMPSWAERVAVMDLSNSSLGLRIATADDGYTYIVEIIPDSQADKAQTFRIGDRIVSIHHQDVAGLDHDELIALLKQRTKDVVVGVVSGAADMSHSQA